MTVGAHVHWQDNQETPGGAIIAAIVKAAAIERIEPEGDTSVVVWKANASEQIEAALLEFGFRVVEYPPREL